MKFKEIKFVSKTDEIIEQIKELIINGTLKPGQKLPSEIEMAEQMGVGRSTLREALKVLICLGFIVRDNKTSYVSNYVMSRIYPHDIIDNFKKHRNAMEMIEVRKIFEPEAAGYAANRGSKEDIDRIEKTFNSMVESSEKITDFIDYDNEYHLSIIQATGNNILIEIMRGIQKLMRENQSLVITKSKEIISRSIEYHKKIYQAIKSSDQKMAKKFMFKHITDIENEMYKILREET